MLGKSKRAICQRAGKFIKQSGSFKVSGPPLGRYSNMAHEISDSWPTIIRRVNHLDIFLDENSGERNHLQAYNL